MPAVSAMAKAPQKTTRAAARQTFAPPAWAPTAPSTASVTSEAVVTMGMIMPAGEMMTASSGMAAPEANVAADVRAACGLHWSRGGDLRDAELIARVRAERVLGHQLQRDVTSEIGIDAALDVDLRQLFPLALDVVGELLRLARQLGVLGIGLRADRDVLAGGHRHGSGNEAGDAGDENVAMGAAGGGDAGDETSGGQDTVVGAEHGSTQPADAADEVMLGMLR
jgi:hypothetical protein